MMSDLEVTNLHLNVLRKVCVFRFHATMRKDISPAVTQHQLSKTCRSPSQGVASLAPSRSGPTGLSIGSMIGAFQARFRMDDTPALLTNSLFWTFHLKSVKHIIKLVPDLLIFPGPLTM